MRPMEGGGGPLEALAPPPRGAKVGVPSTLKDMENCEGGEGEGVPSTQERGQAELRGEGGGGACRAQMQSS